MPGPNEYYDGGFEERDFGGGGEGDGDDEEGREPLVHPDEDEDETFGLDDGANAGRRKGDFDDFEFDEVEESDTNDRDVTSGKARGKNSAASRDKGKRPAQNEDEHDDEGEEQDSSSDASNETSNETSNEMSNDRRDRGSRSAFGFKYVAPKNRAFKKAQRPVGEVDDFEPVSESDDDRDLVPPRKPSRTGEGKAKDKGKGKKRSREEEREGEEEGEGGLNSDRDDARPSASRRKKRSRTKRASPDLDDDAEPAAQAEGTGSKYCLGRNKAGARVPWGRQETALLIELIKKYRNNWRYMIDLHGEEGTKTTTFHFRNVSSLRDKAVNLAKAYKRRGEPLPRYLEAAVPVVKIYRPLADRERENKTDSEDIDQDSDAVIVEGGDGDE
ncbi:hypothetical protein JCM10212_001140 [Sporobolomyces blumeae]